MTSQTNPDKKQTREPPLPVGIQLTALDESFRDNPHQVLDRLRAQAPVHHDTELGRFVLTRHDDVRQTLRDRNWGVDPRKSAPDAYIRLITGTSTPEGLAAYEPSMLFLDAPDHKRLRALVSQAFNPRTIENMRGKIEATTSALLDELMGKSEIDFITGFAGPLPTLIIADMLGVSPADRDDFKRWSDDQILGFDPLRSEETTKQMNRSSDAMRAYFEKVIAERRASPKDDLISALIRAQAEGDALNDSEVMSLCTLLLIAGNVTTTDLIGNGLHALMTHASQIEKLKASPALIENAVEEMLRFDSPVTDSGRLPFDDTELSGCPVKKGFTVNTSLTAANHDPSIYPDPHTFDIERKDTHHQSFGGGVHMCLGAPLARLEAQIGINAFVKRFPDVRLSPQPARRRHLPSFRGFETLPVLL